LPVEAKGTRALLEKVERLKTEIHRVIVGQERVIEELLVTLLAGGHGLLRGVPGLAKTKLVRTVAEATHLSFKRIQFTPDLLPSDVTGSEVLDDAAGQKTFRFLRGPLFVNLLLADEINRTAPKTQAALLEAMQEHQVTVGGVSYPLPAPFCVLATQNPIEQEGTYPLPEAQLDRFLLCIAVDYPKESEEMAIIKTTTGHEPGGVSPVLDAKEIGELQSLVRDVPVADDLVKDVVRLVRGSRAGEGAAPDVRRWIDWGAGPRAGQALLLSAKALALLSGRFAVSRQDLQRLAAPVLRHRIVLSYAASAEGISSDEVVRTLVDWATL
jgi:MoxR-like ATPase